MEFFPLVSPMNTGSSRTVVKLVYKSHCSPALQVPFVLFVMAFSQKSILCVVNNARLYDDVRAQC